MQSKKVSILLHVVCMVFKKTKFVPKMQKRNQHHLTQKLKVD